MSTVTPCGYKVTTGDVVLAVTGLTVALALAWISVDLLSGGRLTLAVTRHPPDLHAVEDDDDEPDTGTGG